MKEIVEGHFWGNEWKEEEEEDNSKGRVEVERENIDFNVLSALVIHSRTLYSVEDVENRLHGNLINGK